MRENRSIKPMTFASAVDTSWDSRLVAHLHRRGVEDLAVFMLQRLRRPFRIDYKGRMMHHDQRDVGVSVSARLHLEPFGAVTLQLDQPLAACVVDLMVGGTGERDAEPFTEIESTLLHRFAGDLCPVVGRWWREARPGSLRVDSVKVASVPEYDQLVAGEGFSFSLWNGRAGGTISVWYDTDCLKALVRRGLRGSGLLDHRDSQEAEEEADGQPELMTEQLARVRLTLSVLLGRLSLSMRDLMELDAGDVLVTQTSVGGSVAVLVEGRPKFAGVPGRRGGQLAVEVIEDFAKEVELHA